MKALQKKIVMSSTYRQSSRVTKPLLETDPDNRLLARGPRFRLSAQMIRDLALAVSGLYVEKIGGPPVKPYQPAGLWEEIATNKNYELSTGDDLYRRSLYTYWKRTVANPTMMNFDASARETCVPQRSRTNTPLQALNLMNEVTFVEAARVLAERIIEKAGSIPSNRITYAFRLCTARRPRENELRILINSFHHFRVQFNDHPDDALKLVETGTSPRSEKTTVSELAAYTAVASLILNLDETVTKE